MFNLDMIVGIRPDFIRTSEVIRLLDKRDDVNLRLVHTGQHYDKNLSDIFFDELGVPKHNIERLETRAATHNEQHSKLIEQLEKLYQSTYGSDCCIFLGDANAVVGSIVPLKRGIPIVHIEGCMRSYDWSMPEERNRVLIDRISDVIYAYQPEYKVQGVLEGLDPAKIVVTGNVIVDVVQRHLKKSEWNCDICKTPSRGPRFCSVHQYGPQQYALMTLHRNDHMLSPGYSQVIINEVGLATKKWDVPVYLIEMPRLKQLNLIYPDNFIPMEPLPFFEFLRLEKNALIEYTDSGTNQEVAALFGTPCVVTRDCTERPECFDVGNNVLAAAHDIVDATDYVLGARVNPGFSLGDGKSSQRIVDDLMDRLFNNFYRERTSRTNQYILEHWKRYRKTGFTYD